MSKKRKERHPKTGLALENAGPEPLSGGPAVSPRLILVVCFGLAVAGLLIYAQTFRFGFVLYDDDSYVYENPVVRAGISGASLVWAFTTFTDANWHPITWISYLLDARLFGINPGAFHAVNVAFHIGAAMLLFLALVRMTGRPVRSGIVAGVFLVHPLHVESVAWIAERKDVLSTFFEMAALLFYARYVQARSLGRYLLVALAFALGLMAKPMLVTLPLVLLLLDFWPLRRFGWPAKWADLRPVVLEKIPLLALSAAGSLLTFAAQRQSGAVTTLQLFSPGTRLANAAGAYLAYLWQSVWPVNLAVLYPADTAPGMTEGFVAVIVLAAITAAVVRFAGKCPYLATGWFWYLGMLVPVIGLVQVGSQARADRYMYVPQVGITMALVWTLAEWADGRPRWKRPFAIGAAVLLSVYGAMAYAQTGYWRDSHTLFEHALQVTGENPIIQNNLGTVFFHEGNYPAAAEHYRQAVAVDSHYPEAHYSLGLSLAAMGQFDAASAQYRQALLLNPRDGNAHANLGHELLRSGRFDEANKEIESALRLKSDIPLAHADLGLLLAARGDYAGAASHLLETARLAPGDATTEGNLCFALAHAHRSGEAIVHCQAALGLNSKLPGAHLNLGLALAGQGRKAEARAEFEEALRLDPGYAEARAALAEFSR